MSAKNKNFLITMTKMAVYKSIDHSYFEKIIIVHVLKCLRKFYFHGPLKSLIFKLTVSILPMSLTDSFSSVSADLDDIN